MYACSIIKRVKKFSEENPSGEFEMRKLTMNMIKEKEHSHTYTHIQKQS